MTAGSLARGRVLLLHCLPLALPLLTVHVSAQGPGLACPRQDAARVVSSKDAHCASCCSGGPRQPFLGVLPTHPYVTLRGEERRDVVKEKKRTDEQMNEQL